MVNDKDSPLDYQANLVLLNSEYRMLRELQTRSEAEIAELAEKTDKLTYSLITLSEHFKVYKQTVKDLSETVGRLTITIDDLKQRTHALELKLGFVEDHKTKCGVTITNIETAVKQLATAYSEVHRDISALKEALRVISLDTDELNTDYTKFKTDIVVTTRAGSMIKTVAIAIGSAVVTVLGILVSLQQLGWLNKPGP